MPEKFEFTQTDQAPKAIGPYSQAVEPRGFGRPVFLSGQIGLNPETGELVSDDVEAQAVQVLKNLEAVLVATRLTLQDVLKTTVLLADMNDFAKVNAVYAQVFGDHKPARATFAAAGLPKGAKVEIDAIAWKS